MGGSLKRTLTRVARPLCSAVPDPAVNTCSELTTCKDAYVDATKCNSVSPPWHFLNFPSAALLKNEVISLSFF